jgi:hypothetical protein
VPKNSKRIGGGGHFFTNDLLYEVYEGNMSEKEFLSCYAEGVCEGWLMNIEPKYYPIITPAMYEVMRVIGKRDPDYVHWLAMQAVKVLSEIGD